MTVSMSGVGVPDSDIPSTQNPRGPVQLLLITLSALSGSYAAASIGPILEAIRISLSLSDNHLALLVGPALALPIIVAAMPLGIAVDRSRRTGILQICAVALVVGLLLLAFAKDFTWLLLGRGLVGVASSAIAIATTSLVADLYLPEQRGRARAVLTIGQCAGGASAYALGGHLLVTSGLGVDGWRWAFAWLSAPLVFIAVLLMLAKEPIRSGIKIPNPSLKQIALEFRHLGRGVALLMSGIVAAQVSGAAVMAWAAPAFTRAFNLAPDRVGVIIGATTLITAPIAAIAGGIIADICQKRAGPRLTVKVLAAITLLGAPGALFAVASNSDWATVMMAAYLVVEFAAMGMAYTVLTIVIPNELRGVGFAILAAGGAIFATSLSPLLVSILSSYLGGTTMIGVALSWVSVCAIITAAAVYYLGSVTINPAESF
jgi:MFS family permease